MNRGSGNGLRCLWGEARRFNEAPIHESGKYYQPCAHPKN